MEQALLREEGGGPWEEVTVWPATPRSVHRARHELVGCLAAWGMSGLADQAALVLSELMTNALRYGKAPGRGIGTHFVRQPSGVRIEVHDLRDGTPKAREAADDEERGRGLALVDAITGQRWGVTEREGPGKLVWAECLEEAR
jgi:serine/threonine-protein kinase RsbW